jgi:GntR family transcriptional regulator, vanillate catabolism transcriptional regulator
MIAVIVKKHQQTTDNAESQRGRALVSLREMVLRGEFKPGERIFEVPIAERLGVSRTPIRLALERLAQEGLLETIGAGVGFTVREFTIRDVWDAIEARGVLEGAAARLATERLTDARELDRIRRINDELDRISEPYTLASSTEATSDVIIAYADVNHAYHTALVDLAKSPMLSWAIERIQLIPFATPRAVIMQKAAEALTIAKEQHRGILEALANKEGARVEMLVREHARLARRNLELALEQSPQGIGRIPGSQLIKSDSSTLYRRALPSRLPV